MKDYEKEKEQHLPYLNAVEWMDTGAEFVVFDIPPAVKGKIIDALTALEMGFYVDYAKCDKQRMNIHIPNNQPKRRGITFMRVKTIVEGEKSPQ